MKPAIKLNIVSNKKNEIDNSWSVKDIIDIWVPSNWKEVFEDARPELEDISEILEEDKKKNGRYYPDNKNLFRVFELCPLNKVKVVIMGQDPYFNTFTDQNGIHPQAMGMSFSVPKTAPIPSSLRNIYKKLSESVKGFVKPNHGNLESWCFKGVLLLNACLTVRPGEPGCHKELWYGFIKKVINAILEKNKHVIFVLWGRKAQKLTKMIGQRATILQSSHPSGLSAHRGGSSSFFSTDHFNDINKLLRETGQEEINWNLM